MTWGVGRRPGLLRGKGALALGFGDWSCRFARAGVDWVSTACASAGLMVALLFIFGWLAGALVSCCMRYRGFDVGYTFYFH
jgi:hypothetical protein